MPLRFWRRHEAAGATAPAGESHAAPAGSTAPSADGPSAPEGRVARRREWASLPPLAPTVRADTPMLVSHHDEFVRSVSAQQSPLTRHVAAEASVSPPGRVDGFALVLPPPPPIPEPPAQPATSGRAGRRGTSAEPMDDGGTDGDEVQEAPVRRVAPVVEHPVAPAVPQLTQAQPVILQASPPPAPSQQQAAMPLPPVPPGFPIERPDFPPPAIPFPPAAASSSPPRAEGVGNAAPLEVVRPRHARRAAAEATAQADGATATPERAEPAPPAATPPTQSAAPSAPSAPAAAPEAPSAPPAAAPTTPPAPTTQIVPTEPVPPMAPPTPAASADEPAVAERPRPRRVGLGEPLTHIPRPAPETDAAAPGAPPARPLETPVVSPPPVEPVRAESAQAEAAPAPAAPSAAATAQSDEAAPPVQPVLLPEAAHADAGDRVAPVGDREPDSDEPELVHRPERHDTDHGPDGEGDGGSGPGGAETAEELPTVVVPTAVYGVLGPPPGAQPDAPATTPWTTPAVRVQPVPTELRDALRYDHGVDPGDAQVVRGWAVDREAGDRSARAFTRGSQVFLPEAAGPLNEEPARSLLAHELTHVAQQRELGGSLPAEQTGLGRQLEQEARDVESYFRRQPVAAGRPSPPAALGPLPPAMPRPQAPATGRSPVGLPHAAAAGMRQAGWDPGAADEETHRVVNDLLSSGLATRGAGGELVFSRPQAPAMAGAVQHAMEDEGPMLVLPPPTSSTPAPESTGFSSEVSTSSTFEMPAPPPAPPGPPIPPFGELFEPPEPAPAPATIIEGQDQSAIIAAAVAAAGEAVDINDIANRVGPMVQQDLSRQLRFEILRELRRELVIDRERKGRFLDG